MGSVAQLLADSLEAHSIDQVFCVPGESYIGLTSAWLREKKSASLYAATKLVLHSWQQQMEDFKIGLASF